MLAHKYRIVRYIKAWLLSICAVRLARHLATQSPTPDIVSTTYLIPAGLTNEQRAPLQAAIDSSLAKTPAGEYVGLAILWRYAEYLIPETADIAHTRTLIQTMSPPKRDVPTAEELAYALNGWKTHHTIASRGVLFSANGSTPTYITSASTSSASRTSALPSRLFGILLIAVFI